MRFRSAVCVAIVVYGCGSNQAAPQSTHSEQAPASESTAEAGPEPGSKPVGTKLIADVDASEKMFEIGENQGQGGLGKYSLRLDGKYIWPPDGEGCAVLVKCCTELSNAKDELALSCLLALGRDGSCTTALGTTKQIAVEQGVAVPPSCSP